VGAATLLRSLDGPTDELSQVLALLRAAGVEDPEALPLGSGDRRLLELHRGVTARDVEVSAACPECGTLNAAIISEREVPAATPRAAALQGGGLRQPTYRDLAGLPEDEQAAAAELLRRCTVGTPARTPTTRDLELVDDALTGPLELSCAECGSAVLVDVDVQRLVLERLIRHGRAIDVEIHLLASAYHWSLAEIEALTDERRSGLAALVAEGR
jgi:hypothetical protein